MLKPLIISKIANEATLYHLTIYLAQQMSRRQPFLLLQTPITISNHFRFPKKKLSQYFHFSFPTLETHNAAQ